MFKIGDKIVVTNPEHDRIDEIGVITHIDETNLAYPYRIDFKTPPSNTIDIYHVSELKLYVPSKLLAWLKRKG